MGDADHTAYEDAVAEWEAVEQLGVFQNSESESLVVNYGNI